MPQQLPPAEEPLDYARRDLTGAVQVALRRDGHLLTAGERHVVRTFLALPEEAASLYARLHSRRPLAFRRDQLDYNEIDHLDRAAEALLDAGLAWSDQQLPDALLLDLRTVEELRALCRTHRLRVSGRREALLERLRGADLPRAALSLPALLLRHKGLFTRLCRLYLHNHSGDLSALVIARLGHLRFPEYTPTGGLGLFPDRRELLAYERGLLRRWAEVEPADLVAELPELLDEVERRPAPAVHRYRFSSRRFAAERALTAARELERQEAHSAAAAAYERLLQAGLREAGWAARRLAMCLDRLGAPGQAARLCVAHVPDAAPDAALALARTGKRLAKRARMPWPAGASPQLRAAPVREIDLRGAQMPGPRPGYATRVGAVSVERALVELLRGAGRQVFFGEAAPWSTLFGLLCFDALFAPVPGMLPTPLLHRPLDLGAPGFAQRRERWLAPLLDRVRAGEAPAMLREALPRLSGLSLAGVRWDRFTPEQLMELAAAIDGPSLSGVLRCFAEDWRGANRGLPDLCVLPGRPLTLPGARPATLPAGLLLAEVKGPTDSLRDAQRVWIDRLLRLGVPVELWKIQRRKPRKKKAAETNRTLPLPGLG